MKQIIARLLIYLTPALSQIGHAQAYLSSKQVQSYYKKASTEHSSFVSYRHLGKSKRQKDIFYLTISKNTFPANAPSIYFNASHHGNEKLSTEIVYYLTKYIIDHRDSPFLDSILREYILVLQPIVNPDGFDFNTRNDTLGQDPNRDYPFPRRGEEESFRLKETQMVKQILDNHHVFAALSFHSGMSGVLWPWCYSEKRTFDHDIFREISTRISQTMKIQTTKQSYYNYPSRGEFIDYAYMKYRTLALTVELPNPVGTQQFKESVQKGVAGSLDFIRLVQLYHQDKLSYLPKFDRHKF